MVSGDSVTVLDGGKVLVDTNPVVEQDIDDEIKDILNNEQETEVVIADPDHEHEIQEAAPPQGLPAPYTPSEAEVANHNLTHLPYRNWCPICVKGKGERRSAPMFGNTSRGGRPCCLY